MTRTLTPVTTLVAEVDQVLPSFGLAFLLGEDGRDWVVTRSTTGPGLEALTEGLRVRVEIEDRAGVLLATRYEIPA